MNSESAAGRNPATLEPHWLWSTLALGVAGGLAAVAIHFIDPVVLMPEDLGPYPMSPSPEYVQQYNAGVLNMATKNTALYMGLISTTAALALSLTCMNRLGLRGAACWVGTALFAGCLGGYLAGWLAAQVQLSGTEPIQWLGIVLDPMVQSLLIQALAWSLVGIGLLAGSALGAGNTSGIGRVIGHGLYAGCGAAVLFELISSFVFPGANLSHVVPAKLPVKLAWVGCACLMLILAMVVGSRQKKVSSQSEVGSEPASGKA